MSPPPLPLSPPERGYRLNINLFHSNAETLTEAVQCTDDQEGAHRVEQAGHSRCGARKFWGGKIKIIKRPLTIVEFCQCQWRIEFRHVTYN